MEAHFEDFNAADGGYVGTLFNPVASDGAGGPWTWGATGVGGSNAWSALGAEGGSAPFEQLLSSPEISLPLSGPVTLEFDHAYNFEEDWDGGVVMVSINGSPFSQATQFTQNGYNDQVQTSDDWGYAGDFNGLNMFSINSGGFIHSVAELGTLNAGDTLQIQFRGGWDWGFLQPPAGEPQWIVDNVLVSQVPEPSTLSLVAMACLGLLIFRKRR